MNEPDKAMQILYEYGVIPSKQSILSKIVTKLLFRKYEKCICGRPLKPLPRVCFSVKVADNPDGSSVWAGVTLCVWCFKVNVDTLRFLRRKGIIGAITYIDPTIPGELVVTAWENPPKE